MSWPDGGAKTSQNKERRLIAERTRLTLAGRARSVKLGGLRGGAARRREGVRQSGPSAMVRCSPGPPVASRMDYELRSWLTPGSAAAALIRLMFQQAGWISVAFA